MKFVRFLFLVLLFVCCLFTFPLTALSDSGYKFVSKLGPGSLGDGTLKYPMAVAVDASGNVYVADSGNHRIQKFSSSGNFITKWGSQGTGDGQFQAPYDIAVDASGNVYVSDSTNNRIQKFSASGVFITKWGSQGKGDGQFNYTRGIAVDASGNIYVADSNNRRIQKFTSSGIFITKWGLPGSGDGHFYSPTCVAVDASGNVYVLDFGSSGSIQKFDSTGQFIAKWGSVGKEDGQFGNPRGMAVDASGNVYVTNSGISGEVGSSIQKYSSSGSFIAKWNSQNTGIVNLSPYGIDIDASGNIYITDVGNFCIQKLSSKGVLITGWGSSSGDGQFWYPNGVAVDASGNVYVVDTSNCRIQKFSSSGVFITKWGSYGTGDGQFNTPWGIAVDLSGNVYVSETGNHRIQKFSASGAFISKWGSQGSGDGQFYYPNAVAVDASGNVYVADMGNNRIQKFSSEGVFITKWDSQGSGDGQFSHPGYVAIDAAGNVYVADGVNNRIQKFSSSGAFIAKWSLSSAIDCIAVDALGNVYVADHTYNCILKFSSSGVYITKWGSRGSGDGEFDAPVGIAVDSTGNVYVVDSENWNVQKFSPGTPTGSITPLYYHHIATSLPWQTEIAVINTGDQTVTGTLRGLSDEGLLIETKLVYLNHRSRRQITVANEFTNHTNIGYIVFDADSAAVQGYMKFYTEGKYRAAIPAVKEVNTSDIYISHIASNTQWWTGISLLNTTSAMKELTITFNTGEIRFYTLNANGHKSFDIAQEFFNNQPRPDIESAVITHADGVIGLELFGNIGGGDHLDGILLTDKTASTLYYPHVASNDQWWTGIVAYNPSDLASTITITPYTVDGSPLSPITPPPIAGKGKYIGLVSALGLPAQTAWFKMDSSLPLTGFELFGANNGNQLAAYAAEVGTGAKAGVFPKIEKSGGWTGIAFVNMEDSIASVTLTAYNDYGFAVATKTLTVFNYAKVVDLVENIFYPQDISVGVPSYCTECAATYIAFSSTRNVIGLQLNGTSDGMMLDGLPALAGTH